MSPQSGKSICVSRIYGMVGVSSVLWYELVKYWSQEIGGGGGGEGFWWVMRKGAAMFPPSTPPPPPNASFLIKYNILENKYSNILATAFSEYGARSTWPPGPHLPLLGPCQIFVQMVLIVSLRTSEAVNCTCHLYVRLRGLSALAICDVCEMTLTCHD